MFTDTDLRDPAPPVPGAAERAAVATRAKQIQRNRRVAAAGGALGVVAVLSLGVAAFAGGGSTNPSTTQVEVAGTSGDREAAPATYTVSGSVPGTSRQVPSTVRLQVRAAASPPRRRRRQLPSAECPPAPAGPVLDSDGAQAGCSAHNVPGDPRSPSRLIEGADRDPSTNRVKRPGMRVD
jgi:hypothetical protein